VEEIRTEDLVSEHGSEMTELLEELVREAEKEQPQIFGIPRYLNWKIHEDWREKEVAELHEQILARMNKQKLLGMSVECKWNAAVQYEIGLASYKCTNELRLKTLKRILRACTKTGVCHCESMEMFDSGYGIKHLHDTLRSHAHFEDSDSE